MLGMLSIRLKIVLLSGLCLLGVIALIVSINLYQSHQNNQLTSDSSSSMFTSSVESLLQAKAAEQALQLQKTFGYNLTALTALKKIGHCELTSNLPSGGGLRYQISVSLERRHHHEAITHAERAGKPARYNARNGERLFTRYSLVKFSAICVQ